MFNLRQGEHMHTHNYLDTHGELTSARWRKSSRSAHDGNCVEIAPFSGRVAVRDSKNPEGAPVVVPARAWTAFVEAVKG
jgi:hypothetical protein